MDLFKKLLAEITGSEVQICLIDKILSDPKTGKSIKVKVETPMKKIEGGWTIISLCPAIDRLLMNKALIKAEISWPPITDECCDG